MQGNLQTIQIIRPMERHPRAAGLQAPLVPDLHLVLDLDQEVLSLPAACHNLASSQPDGKEILTMTIARHRKEDSLNTIINRLSTTLTLITIMPSMRQTLPIKDHQAHSQDKLVPDLHRRVSPANSHLKDNRRALLQDRHQGSNSQDNLIPDSHSLISLRPDSLKVLLPDLLLDSLDSSNQDNLNQDNLSQDNHSLNQECNPSCRAVQVNQ